MSIQRRLGILFGVGLTLIAISLSSAALLRADSRQIPMQTHDFTDVPVAGKEFMEPFIDAFYHQGVTGGCGVAPLRYCPEDNVTRAEMAVFIGRALGYVEMEADGFSAEAYFDNTNAGIGQYGVVGRSTQGTGVYGRSGAGYGVFGYGTGSGDGVYGLSFTGNGVTGYSEDSTGVRAFSENGAFALRAENETGHGLLAQAGADDLSNDTEYDVWLGGVLGEIYGNLLMLFSDGDVIVDLDNNNNGQNGFYIRDSSNNTILSVDEAGNLHVDGNLSADGAKPATVETENHGKREIYAIESPEIWFEDFGSAQLVDGVAVIGIEAIFAETVNLDEEYHVYLTPIGSAEVLYVEAQSPTSFTVRSADRNADIRFHYRIVAKRLGYEDVRMEEVSD